MSDAGLERIVDEIFNTECDRMQRDVLTAITPGQAAFRATNERLVMHRHAAIAVLSQVIADIIAAVPDATRRKHLRTAVMTTITLEPPGKELH